MKNTFGFTHICILYIITSIIHVYARRCVFTRFVYEYLLAPRCECFLSQSKHRKSSIHPVRVIIRFCGGAHGKHFAFIEFFIFCENVCVCQIKYKSLIILFIFCLSLYTPLICSCLTIEKRRLIHG